MRSLRLFAVSLLMVSATGGAVAGADDGGPAVQAQPTLMVSGLVPGRNPVIPRLRSAMLPDGPEPQPLGLAAPSSPDGLDLAVTVTDVPAIGTIRDGRTAVRPGDRLSVEALTRLTYDHERAAPGDAGVFGYRVEDVRGG